MTQKLVVGISGCASDERAVDFARRVASLGEGCEMILCFVIEWSPYSFQTQEENANRQRRREEEVQVATERVLAPLVEKLKSDGFSASGIVRHGNVAEILNEVASKEGALQLIVGRTSDGGIASRVFGSVATRVAASSSVPVTVVG